MRCYEEPAGATSFQVPLLADQDIIQKIIHFGCAGRPAYRQHFIEGETGIGIICFLAQCARHSDTERHPKRLPWIRMMPGDETEQFECLMPYWWRRQMAQEIHLTQNDVKVWILAEET